MNHANALDDKMLSKAFWKSQCLGIAISCCLCYTEKKHYSSKNHMAKPMSDYLFSILMRSQCFSNSLINKSSEVLERKKMPPAILHKEVCICV